MKVLYKRELRRLAPYALGMTAAAGAYGVYAGFAWSSDRFFDANPWRYVCMAIVLLPALLGVVSVAPDTSSGGLAFLARLPLSPARALATKAGAALTWWVPILTLIAAAAAATIGPEVGGPDLLGRAAFVAVMELCGVFSFGVGLLASVVASRALPAVLIAPTLAIGGLLLAVGGPFLALRMPAGNGFGIVVAFVLGLAFLATAFLSYAHGDRHRASFRPALLAAAALVPVFLGGFGVTAVAHAWAVEQAVPHLLAGPTPGLASPDGSTLAVPLEGDGWTGVEQRVAVVSRLDRGVWVPPVRYAVEPQFSPDSTQLVLRHALDPGGWLVDLESHEVRELHGAAPSGIGFKDAIWSSDGPYFVRDRGDWVEGFDPAQPCDYDPQSTPPEPTGVRPFGGGWHYLGVRGQALVFSHAQLGVVEALPDRGAGNPSPLRVDLSQATPLVEWPAGTVPLKALLAPDGQHVLVLPSGEEHRTRLLLCDLRGPAPVWLHTTSDGVRLEETRVSWSPQQKSVAVEYPNGRIGVFELSTGIQRAELASSRPPQGGQPTTGRVYRRGPVVWSPAGNRLSTPAGLLIELEAEPMFTPVSESVLTGDRYFSTNFEGVVFYTSSATFELNEGPEDPRDCTACTNKDKHVCLSSYTPPCRLSTPDTDPGTDAETEAEWDASSRSGPEAYGELKAVPAVAAFVDAHTVIRLFEPLSISSLDGRAASSLLKGGE